MRYAADYEGFAPWLPSTWPEVQSSDELAHTLNKIFSGSIILEIDNCISDSQEQNGTLEHRGHVLSLGLLCAAGALSTYASTGNDNVKYKFFVRTYFPAPYSGCEEQLYLLYRNSLVHSWNLFGAAIFLGDEKLTISENSVSFGLLNYLSALKTSIENFTVAVRNNPEAFRVALQRYNELRKSAVA